MTRAATRVGQLVTCRDLNHGIAKVEQIDGERAQIVFFDSVATRHSYTVPTESLTPYVLYPQNRCYVNDGGYQWRVGRLDDLRDAAQRWYGIQFPNGKFEEVPEQNVYVRWAAPIHNPTEVLELHGHETPFWFDRRWPMVQALTAQRAAARGLNALLSSAVELREHQVDVVLRVLQDPVQRYLLADEVGLGKTIEAGLIIRQRLLDDPRSHVVVLVPDSLMLQWTEELHHKFFVRDFPHATVEIISQHDLALPDRADLVVVDEAHHLAAGAYGDAAAQARYAALERLARATPRLLLLSATPAASDQRGFLAMLHLLEPDVYRLDDLVGFERRVAERESIGALFYSLDEDTPTFLLEDTISEVREHFPNDAHLLHLCRELEAALDDDDARPRMIRAIRVHVSETYRLHRRMIRHRRLGRAGDVVRGRHYAGTLPWQSGGLQGAWAALDEWRESLAVAAEQGDIPQPDALTLLITVLNAAASPVTLRPLLTARLGDAAARRTLTSEQRQALQAPLFPDEPGMLRAVLNLLPSGDATVLVDAVIDRNLSGKIVLFTVSTVLAAAVAGELRGRFGAGAVAEHAATAEVEAQDAEVYRFRQEEECRYLVADASAEEGRNFQFAEHLVHLDLPLNVNRLEQRLGRLDRYGRGDPVPSYILLPDDAPAWLQGWLDILNGSLGMFDSSVAALQFLMDDLQAEAAAALLHNTLGTWGQALAGQIKQEVTRLQRQDALDAIDLGTGVALTEMMDALYDNDAQFKSFSRVMQNWMLDALHFTSEKDGECIRFAASPERPATLVPWERLQADFRHLPRHTGTFRRAAALKHPGVHLYRLGDPTVDALHAYLNWDDRGQSYAMWRFDVAWTHLRDLRAFRFNYLVEGNLSVLTEQARTLGWDEGALRRRLDALLPPTTHTVWLTDRGLPVPDDATEMLERPFGKVRPTFPPEQLDYNLSWERLWVLRESMTDSEWISTCREVHQRAEAAVRVDPTLQGHLQQCLAEAQRRLHVSLEQLRTRAARLGTAEAQRELALEERLTPLLEAALREPHLKLDSVGFVVLSGRDPFIDEVSGA